MVTSLFSKMCLTFCSSNQNRLDDLRTIIQVWIGLQRKQTKLSGSKTKQKKAPSKEKMQNNKNPCTVLEKIFQHFYSAVHRYPQPVFQISYTRREKQMLQRKGEEEKVQKCLITQSEALEQSSNLSDLHLFTDDGASKKNSSILRIVGMLTFS